MIIRVASVPSQHVYVRHLGVPGDRVVRIADPNQPETSSSIQARTMLTAKWVNEHASEFDVFHVHFRSEQQSMAGLRSWAKALSAVEKPLVFTVHDLQNPHTVNQQAHQQRLDLLVESACELITLTPLAAQRVLDVWGRTSSVVPHPHVVPLSIMARAQRRGHEDPYVIGVHLKSMRPGVSAEPVIAGLKQLVATSGRFHVRVDINRDAERPTTDAPAHKILRNPGAAVNANQAESTEPPSKIRSDFRSRLANGGKLRFDRYVKFVCTLHLK